MIEKTLENITSLRAAIRCQHELWAHLRDIEQRTGDACEISEFENNGFLVCDDAAALTDGQICDAIDELNFPE